MFASPTLSHCILDFCLKMLSLIRLHFSSICFNSFSFINISSGWVISLIWNYRSFGSPLIFLNLVATSLNSILFSCFRASFTCLSFPQTIFIGWSIWYLVRAYTTVALNLAWLASVLKNFNGLPLFWTSSSTVMDIEAWFETLGSITIASKYGMCYNNSGFTKALSNLLCTCLFDQVIFLPTDLSSVMWQSWTNWEKSLMSVSCTGLPCTLYFNSKIELKSPMTTHGS